MSSDRPRGARSPAPSTRSTAPDPEVELARIVRGRGAPLLDALEARLPGSREHADGAAAYAFAAAVELGHRRSRAELIRAVARLHEIGEVYGGGHVAGGRLARGAGLPDDAAAWIAAAGERFDGLGPTGLAGERIPLEARIIRAACACDRSGADPADLRIRAGDELDPKVVDALATIVGRVSA